jgi:23S rRNA pseudouridine955/2504/2580 synthase/23S rRNA pseudouridine1911/1915/1917 synthase
MHGVKPTILAQTENWIAVNKPSGMLTLPDRHLAELESLRGWLQQKLGTVYTVHRIDKDTSGIIIFALNEKSHQFLSQLFENREVKKIYHAIVHGTPAQDEGTIDAPIAEHPAKNGTMMVHSKGKRAVSHYRVLQRFGKYSLLEFNIETGRTHQIRVHARHIGNAVVCDPFYGDGKPVRLSDFKRKVKLGKYVEEETPLLNRLGLHAFQLSFTDMDGKLVELEAPYYKDMRALLSQLEKNV